MDTWFQPVCQVFAPEMDAMLAVACVLLALLLLAVIALGFRPRSGWGALARGRELRMRRIVADDGVRATWQLYRALGRAERLRP